MQVIASVKEVVLIGLSLIIIYVVSIVAPLVALFFILTSVNTTAKGWKELTSDAFQT